MGSKLRKSVVNNPELFPGPGSYEPDSFTKRSKSYSIGIKFTKSFNT